MSTRDKVQCLLAVIFVAVIVGAAAIGVSPKKIFALMVFVAFLVAVVGAGAAGDGKDDGFY